MDLSIHLCHFQRSTGFVYPLYLQQQCSKIWLVKRKRVCRREYCYFLQNSYIDTHIDWLAALGGQNGDQNDSKDKDNSNLFRFRSTRKSGFRGDNIEEKNTKRVLNVWSSETGFLVALAFVFLLFLFYLYEYLKEYYFKH